MGDQRLVSRGKRVVAQALRGDPRQFLAFTGCDRTDLEATAKEVQDDVSLAVVPGDSLDLLFHSEGGVQLLGQLSTQTLNGALPRLALPSGKLPESCQVRSRTTAYDEIASGRVTDDSGRHLHDRPWVSQLGNWRRGGGAGKGRNGDGAACTRGPRSP